MPHGLVLVKLKEDLLADTPPDIEAAEQMVLPLRDLV
mgnify:CR=1 FL=1